MSRHIQRYLLLGSFLAAISTAVLADVQSAAEEPVHVDILGSEQSLYSQHHEEVIIRDFFQDRRNGTFVDIGAAMSIHHSTTYFLEHHLGWSGIAVDALDEFRRGYEKNRPSTRFFAYIVTDHSGAVERFYRLGTFRLMSTRVKDQAEKFGKDEFGRANYEIVEIPTITMNELLADVDVSEIDLLSMDIELGEPAALAGFDIERFRPKLVCIEANPQIHDELLAYFGDHGYERIERYSEFDGGQNWYFTPAASNTRGANH